MVLFPSTAVMWWFVADRVTVHQMNPKGIHHMNNRFFPSVFMLHRVVLYAHVIWNYIAIYRAMRSTVF